MAFLQVYIYFIGLCFLVSLTVFYISPKNRAYLKFFPVFLFMTFVVETLATYMASRRENNVALYNFFTAFEFCFYLGVLRHMISNVKAKKIIRIIVPVYALAAVINILFIQKVNTIHTITY